MKGLTYFLHSEDIIYIPSETDYTLESDIPCLILYINFHPYFLLESLGFHQQDISYCSQHYPKENSEQLSNHLASLAVAYITEHQNNECQILSKAYDLLYRISLFNMKETPPVTTSKTELKLLQYQTFLEKNYSKQISLSDTAYALNYTPQYLSNYLKKNLNMTFQENLNQLRLQASLLLVKFSEESPGRIATFCGFPNMPSFLKNFENEFHMSPDEYRSQYQKERVFQPPTEFVSITNETLLLDYIFNYMHYVMKGTSLHEQYIMQEEKVNLSKFTPIKPYWNYMINLGTITDFEKPSFRYALRIIQDRLHFKYGRCIGIFLLINVHNMDGQDTYDFSRLFDVIDYLISIQMKPLFELSNKPFHIYKADELELTDYNEFLEADKYDHFFFHVLPVFIRVCITRYGFDEFASWKFELWRRYNPSMTSLEAPADYCARFQQTSSILKSMVPNVSLGGPGFNTFLGIEYFEELLKPFLSALYKPDFLSAYYFPYLPQHPNDNHLPAGYTTVPTSNTMLEKIGSLNACKSRNDMGDIPLYITEYSSYLSKGNYINDSPYPAVFILQQMLESYGKADVLAYWLASDISLSYGNYASPLFGGNGIISKDAIPKASFHAFSFLNQLGDHFVTKGEHYIVTRSEDNSIQVLVFYPTNLNSKFAASPFNQELLHYPYSAFEDVLPLSFCIHLTHMATGNYLLKEHTINLKHGNVLSSWGQLNYWKALRSEEIEYLQHESIPSVKINTAFIEDSFYLQTKLGYNEAKLFTLELHI
jgi:beta-xylosidase/AraC-like DNA-binding protein